MSIYSKSAEFDSFDSFQDIERARGTVLVPMNLVEILQFDKSLKNRQAIGTYALCGCVATSAVFRGPEPNEMSVMLSHFGPSSLSGNPWLHIGEVVKNERQNGKLVESGVIMAPGKLVQDLETGMWYEKPFDTLKPVTEEYFYLLSENDDTPISIVGYELIDPLQAASHNHRGTLLSEIVADDENPTVRTFVEGRIRN